MAYGENHLDHATPEEQRRPEGMSLDEYRRRHPQHPCERQAEDEAFRAERVAYQRRRAAMKGTVDESRLAIEDAMRCLAAVQLQDLPIQLLDWAYASRLALHHLLGK